MPIAFASRCLNEAEKRYPVHKLELLALKWAISSKFHDYLYGGLPFVVYTDNNPVTYALSSAKLDACSQRWVAELANYNFEIVYKTGKSNLDADALSRIVWPDHGQTLLCGVTTRSGLDTSSSFPSLSNSELVKLQRDDETLGNIIDCLCINSSNCMTVNLIFDPVVHSAYPSILSKDITQSTYLFVGISLKPISSRICRN